MGELAIRKILLPKKGKDYLRTEKFEQFKNKINHIAFYTPFLTLLLLSLLLTFFLNNWLNFFVLYASIISVYAVVLFKQDSIEFWLAAILAIVYRIIPLFNSSVLLSNDILQYGSFGTKILEGLIPYKGFDAPYPPLSLYVTVPFVMMSDLRFLKALFSLCDILIVFIVYKIFLQGAENAKRISMLLLLFPVSLVEYSISGHNDSLAVLLLIASLALLDKSIVGSSALMALSILCKIFPIILVPFVLKQLYSNNRKSALVFLSMLVTVFSIVSLPFVLISWDGYISMIIGITRYSVPYGILTWLFNPLVDFTQSSIMFFHLLAIILLIEFCAFFFFISSRRKWPLMKTCSICLLVLPLLLPQFHPWYLLWALPFITTCSSNNLKLIRGYMLLFLFSHILYYLLFSFNQL